MLTFRSYRSSLVAFAGFLGLLTAGTAGAMDAVVPTDFPTINAAIAGATDLDLNGTIDILVMDGTYTEDVILNRSDVVLMGASAEMTVIQGSGVINTLRFDGVTNSRVQGFTLLGAPTANVVSILGSTGCTLQQTIVDGGNTGIAVRDSNDNFIVGNEVRNNVNGLKVRTSSGNTVATNSVHDQVKSGIVLRVGDSNLIDQNLVTANGGHGIRLREGAGNFVSGNTVTASGGQGIRVRQATTTTVSGNVSSTNAKNGLRMRDTSGSLVSMNSFNGNGEYGVRRRGWLDDDFDAATEGIQDPAGDNDLSGNVLGELLED
ncbi:MAG: right-handed parallel beta-helix repeat-containing protein [Acidobacteria bacterium]|nr:right-handed parallel beta-helix repeat-containing protein [Acidobacteriota bacterium]